MTVSLELVAGIVVGCVVGNLVASVVIYCMDKRRRKEELEKFRRWTR